MQNALHIGAERSPERASARRFRVAISVTRCEYYEIDAPDEATAYEDAFVDGELVDVGETTAVHELSVEEVQS